MLEFISGMISMLLLLSLILYVLVYIYGSKTLLKGKRKSSLKENILLNDTIHKTVYSALNVLITNITKQFIHRIKVNVPFIEEFSLDIDWDGYIECTSMRSTVDYSIFTLVVHPPLMIQIQGNVSYNQIYLPFVMDLEPMATFEIGLDLDSTMHQDGIHSTLKIQLLDYSLDLSMNSSIGGTIKLNNVEKLHKLIEYIARDYLDMLKTKPFRTTL